MVSLEMSSSRRTVRGTVPGKCRCGLPSEVSRDVSPETYGKMYERCPFFSGTDKYTGCGYFKWVEVDETQWQKDAIEELIATKNKLEKSFLEAVSNVSFLLDRFAKAAEENEILRCKNVQLTEHYVFCKCVEKFKFLVVLCYVVLFGCLGLCVAKCFW